MVAEYLKKKKKIDPANLGSSNSKSVNAKIAIAKLSNRREGTKSLEKKQDAQREANKVSNFLMQLGMQKSEPNGSKIDNIDKSYRQYYDKKRRKIEDDLMKRIKDDMKLDPLKVGIMGHEQDVVTVQ